MTGTPTAGTTPDATAAPDATLADVPTLSQGASSADMLTQSEWTRRVVTVACMIVVGLSMLGIVGVMCYRVAVDGNAPLTTTITSQLLWIALAGFVSMAAALFGSNSILSKLIEKVAP